MAKRVKKMGLAEFELVMERDWRPVQLVGDAVPDWMQGIPEDKLDCIVASGINSFPGVEWRDQEAIPSGQLIGGIDVYRLAPDDPVELNKDWYAVIRVPGIEGELLVPGPFKDDEHWINEIPERLQGAEVLGVPTTTAHKSKDEDDGESR